MNNGAYVGQSMAAVVSIPVFMMGGVVRPFIGVMLVALSVYLIWKRARSGWQLPTNGLA